jgi:flagellar hook-length control protein FliK
VVNPPVATTADDPDGDDTKPASKAPLAGPTPAVSPNLITGGPQPLTATAGTPATAPVHQSAPAAPPQTLAGLDEAADQNATRVLAGLRSLRATGESSISVNLEPAHLGSVRLDMTTHNGDVTIRISAEGRSTADTLSAAAPALRRELEADGVHLADLHVGVGSSTGGDQGGRSANTGSNGSEGAGDGATPGRSSSPGTSAMAAPRAGGRHNPPSPSAPRDGHLAVDL